MLFSPLHDATSERRSGGKRPAQGSRKVEGDKGSHVPRKRHLRQPNFSNGLTKLAILPDYKLPGMLCLALLAHTKVQKVVFQSEFYISKIIRMLLIFLSLKKNRLDAHLLLSRFFDNFNLKQLYY